MIDIRGIILAGGNGTRLFPLTKTTNKHILPVYDRPMIYFPLQTLIDAQITDVMIVAGKGHAGSFLELLGDGSEFKVNLSYMVQEQPKGIAHALGLCKKFTGDENIAVILGDNIFENKFDFSNFREGSRIYLKSVSNKQAKRFGIAGIDKNRIIGIIEKPTNPPESAMAVTGLYLYDSTVFDKISCLRPSNRNELEITDLNNMYIKEDRMDFEIITKFWSDAGTFSSLFNASEFVKKSINNEKGDGHLSLSINKELSYDYLDIK